MTAEQDRLAERIRNALQDTGPVREVPMFGGLAFMLNEKIAVSAATNGDLLVRALAERHDELTARPGAKQAVMGAGRRMGRGWIAVAAEAIGDDDALSFWIQAALQRNRLATGSSDT